MNKQKHKDEEELEKLFFLMKIPKPFTSNSSFSPSRTPSFKTISSSKLDYLYEIKYLSEDSKILATHFSVVNLYFIYCKPQSTIKKKIKKLVGSKNPTFVKEYV